MEEDLVRQTLSNCIEAAPARCRDERVPEKSIDNPNRAIISGGVSGPAQPPNLIELVWMMR